MKLQWTPQAFRPVSAIQRQAPKPVQFGLTEAAHFNKSDYYRVVESNLSKRELALVLERLDTLKSVQALGRGLHGVTYKITLPGTRQRTVVVKISRNNRSLTKPGNLSTEARLLHQDSICYYLEGDNFGNVRLVPYDRSGGQRLLAHLQRDGKDILITNFVSGNNPNLQNNPLTPKMLQAMMREMLYWQRLGILHYDNQFKNWLVSGDLAFLIDFEWAEMQAERLKKQRKQWIAYGAFETPENIFGLWSLDQAGNEPISNLDIFETHALFGSYFFDNLRQGLKTGQSLITDQEIRQVFKMYLQAAAYFQEHCPPRYCLESGEINGIDLQAHFFKNPNPKVIMLEALRIQAPFDDERDFHATVIHQGSAEEHIRWRWNAHQHALRYLRSAYTLYKNALQSVNNLDKSQAKLRDSLHDSQQENKIQRQQYFYYHALVAASQCQKARSKLEEAVQQYTKRDAPPLNWADYAKMRNIKELLSRLDIPVEPKKAFDNPDDYDIAARIIGAVNQDIGKTPGLSPFHKL